MLEKCLGLGMVDLTEELQALNQRWAWEVLPEGLSACRWAGMEGGQAGMGQAVC